MLMLLLALAVLLLRRLAERNAKLSVRENRQFLELSVHEKTLCL
jgi:hypothetical protein